MSRPSQSSTGHGGFTLLEVILALAILAGSVAVLGEIMRSAGRAASDAQGETRAQLLACSIMDQVVAGLIEAVDQNQVPLETDDLAAWNYSLAIGQTSFADLLSVEVLVEQELEPQYNPIRYRLVRWVAVPVEEDDSGDEQQGTDEGASDEA